MSSLAHTRLTATDAPFAEAFPLSAPWREEHEGCTESTEGGGYAGRAMRLRYKNLNKLRHDEDMLRKAACFKMGCVVSPPTFSAKSLNSIAL